MGWFWLDFYEILGRVYSFDKLFGGQEDFMARNCWNSSIYTAKAIELGDTIINLVSGASFFPATALRGRLSIIGTPVVSSQIFWVFSFRGAAVLASSVYAELG
jgi:hypothetical protein